MSEPTLPMCWKCSSCIQWAYENPWTGAKMIGCKEEPNIHDYADAKALCPLIQTEPATASD